MRLATRLCLMSILLLVFAVALPGQDITGSITGTVTDQSGAVVRGAVVTVTNTDTNLLARTETTNDAGNYTAPLLAIGHYSVSVAAPGFATSAVTAIELHVNDEQRYDFSLKPSSTGELVTVEASPVQVDTQTATAAGLITGQQITELSINNRNYEQLVSLQPGVSYGGATDQLYIGVTVPQGGTSTLAYSINGQRTSANNWTVDGADNVDRGSNLSLLTYPSVDAIAEFKVLRGLYSAEFGRAAGGMINVVTKSGSDKFHGDAYEFFRNDVLNANTYFNKLASVAKPKLRYNNFGGTIGGPVRIPGLYTPEKNKTFFFYSEELRRIINYATVNGTIPTVAERSGTFNAPVCIAFSAAGVCTATGTQVTAINPVAAAYLKDIINGLPAPNSPIDPHVLISNFRTVLNSRQELLRLDHRLTDKLSLAFRFINDTIPTIEPGGLFTGASLPGVGTTQTNSPGRSYLGTFTGAITPTLLIDGGVAYSFGAILSDPIGSIGSANSPDVRPALPFPSSLARIPAVTFSGGSSITSFGPYRDFNRDYNVFSNLTKIVSQHNLKFGGTYHRYQKNENAGGNNTGTFGFNSTGRPAGSAATTFQQSFASFLSGFVGSYTQASLDLTPDIHASQLELYGQDEYKLRPNLTVNFGLRWSLFRQPTDHNHFLSNFDPRRYNPASAAVISLATGNIVTPATDPLNGIIVNGTSSPFGQAVAPTNYKNFSPRFGLAWDPWGDGKTSIRTGYGLSYDSSLFGVYEQNIFTNLPFVQSITIPNTRFDNAGGGAAVVSAAPRSLRGTPNSDAVPYTQQWSFDMQHEFPKRVLLDIGYYGAKSTHLIGLADINQPQPGAYQNVPGLATPIAGQFLGKNTSQLNAIRPYLGYGPISAIEPWFKANYNSLQTSVQKRFSGGSLVNLAYTWSHGLTNAQTDRSSAPQNTYCLQCEYGSTQNDRRHVFSANYVYEIPFMRNQEGVVGHLLGGWEVSGIVAANSGLPFTVFDGSATNFDPAGQGVRGSSPSSLRPDKIGDPNSGAPRTLLQWFNTAAFAAVPAGQARPGNSSRGAVRGPGFYRFDASLFKNIKLYENLNMQLRAEAFNLMNHTNFNSINTTFGNPSFGQVTTVRDNRIMQLALKIRF